MRSILSFLAALFFASPALADPLAISSIPADTRWVMHIDVDAGRKTPLWDLARARFVQPQRELLLPRLEVLQRLTGMKLPQDLHDVTLYGSAYDESAVCILIHGNIDQELTTTFLKTAGEFRSEDHNGHAILSWRDKQRDRLMYGAFSGTDVAILGPDPKLVALALDTLDGKSPALKYDSPLAPGGSASNAGGRKSRQPFFWIAGTDISELTRLHKTESPLVSQVDVASLGATWSEAKFATSVKVVAKSEKTAQQMLALAEGVKAMVALAAADDHAAPGAKLAAEAFEGLAITTAGRQVAAEWSLSLDKIEALINAAKQDLAPTIPASIAAPAPPPADKNH